MLKLRSWQQFFRCEVEIQRLRCHNRDASLLLSSTFRPGLGLE